MTIEALTTEIATLRDRRSQLTTRAGAIRAELKATRTERSAALVRGDAPPAAPDPALEHEHTATVDAIAALNSQIDERERQHAAMVNAANRERAVHALREATESALRARDERAAVVRTAALKAAELDKECERLLEAGRAAATHLRALDPASGATFQVDRFDPNDLGASTVILSVVNYGRALRARGVTQ